MKARIKFRKYGTMKFIGHLDVMRFFQKAMRRAQIPIAFTAGYSPHMIMSFAQPLGVGITSDGEYMDVELTDKISTGQALDQLNKVMVEGIEVVDFVEISDEKKASGMTITAAASYQVFLLESSKTSDVTLPIPDMWKEKIPPFLSQEQILVWKKTKRSEAEVDIRPMIYEMEERDGGIFLFLAAGSEQNLKPDLVMQTFLAYMNVDEGTAPLHYRRKELFARNEKGEYITLADMGSRV